MAFPPFSHCQASEGETEASERETWASEGETKAPEGRPRLLGGRPTLLKGRPQGLRPHHLFHPPCNSPQGSPNNGQGLLVTPTLQMAKSIRQSWLLPITGPSMAFHTVDHTLHETLPLVLMTPNSLRYLGIPQCSLQGCPLFPINIFLLSHSKGFSYWKCLWIKISNISISTKQTCDPAPYGIFQSLHTR